MVDFHIFETMRWRPACAFAPGGFAPGGFAPGGFDPGGFAPGGFAPGGFAPGGFAPGGFAPGGFDPEGFNPGGFAPGGFAPGGFDPGGFAPGGFDRGNAHLRRMASSARHFGLPFDPHAIHAALDNELSGMLVDKRVRVALYEDGELVIDVADAPPEMALGWRLGLAATRLEAGDMWLRHKTSNRQRYEEDRAAFCRGVSAQFDELIYLNQNGDICEGTITSLFIDDGSGMLKTPALECGLLPGILRATMLQNDKAVEAVLTLDDLRGAEAVFVGNSLSGLIQAELAF